MLTKSGSKLLDFGLAKPRAGLFAAVAADEATISKSLTEEGVIVGTLRYMSPEQLEGKDSDSRSDIFALGALLYEMCVLSLIGIALIFLAMQYKRNETALQQKAAVWLGRSAGAGSGMIKRWHLFPAPV